MEIFIGKDKWKGNKVFLNTKKVINNHMMIVGGSGSGKTYNIRKIVRELAKDKKNEIHVLDVHGDIEVGDDLTSSIEFSELSKYGLQPLEISSDPTYGGVRKKIRSFISMLNRTSRKLGSKQEPVLMNLMTDLYSAFGFLKINLNLGT